MHESYSRNILLDDMSPLLSASPEYYFTPLHTPASSPPPYVYPNCLPSPGLPRVPPGELADGEFLSNTVLSLKYKSIAISIGENSVDKNIPEHI